LASDGMLKVRDALVSGAEVSDVVSLGNVDRALESGYHSGRKCSELGLGLT